MQAQQQQQQQQMQSKLVQLASRAGNSSPQQAAWKLQQLMQEDCALGWKLLMNLQL
jgi:hypothetical protein